MDQPLSCARDQREHRRDSRAGRGARKPEWRCRRCAKLNFWWDRASGAESTHCRQCDCPKDDRCSYVDAWGVEHAAATQQWPTVWDSAWSNHSRQRSQTPPRGAIQHTTTAHPVDDQATPTVQEARNRLKVATDKGLPGDVMTILRQHLADAEKAANEERPLGKRLDAARSRLKEMTDCLEKRQLALTAAQEKVQEAETEVHSGWDQLKQLMAETAAERSAAVLSEVGRPDRTELQIALTGLADVVRAFWPALGPSGLPLVPAPVVNAMQVAEQLIKAEQPREKTEESEPPTPEEHTAQPGPGGQPAQTGAGGSEEDEDIPPGQADPRATPGAPPSKRQCGARSSDDTEMAEVRPEQQPPQRPLAEPKARPGSIKAVLERAQKALPSLRDRSRSPCMGNTEAKSPAEDRPTAC